MNCCLRIDENRKNFIIEPKTSARRYCVEAFPDAKYNANDLIMTNRSECKVKIFHLADEKWEKGRKYFYRHLVPIDQFFWIDNLCTYVYDRENGNGWSRGLIELNFPEGAIHVYPAKYGKQNYMIVESRMPCTYEDMDCYLYPISLSLGLMASVAPFNYFFFVACEESDFNSNLLCGFTQIRKTIKLGCPFFTTNMYLVCNKLKGHQIDYALKQLYDDSKFLGNLQDRMKMCEFNNLVKTLYENEKLARATLMVLEANTVPLDYQVAVCAVILETICSAIVDKEDKTYMKKEEWKEKVEPMFKELIDNLERDHIINEGHSAMMKNKLRSFNDLSNRDKLVKPFKSIRYKLSKSEQKVINERNRFLHGGILGREIREQIDELTYVSLELQKLCVLLLLRTAGFNGLILNNAVLCGCKKALEDKEPALI